MTVKIDEDVDLASFKTIVCLTLEQSGKSYVIDAINKLKGRNDIMYVGPDMKLTMDSVQSSQSGNYSDPEDIRDLIKLTEALQLLNDTYTVTVGVIDSGMDRSHPAFGEFQFHWNLCHDYVNGTSSNVTTVKDEHGHGTHVGGIIGGQENELLNISGVIPEVMLVSLRIFDENGEGFTSHLVDAIEVAIEAEIPILNYSGGSYVELYNTNAYAPLQSVLERYNGLFVCSAGNKNLNNDLPENIHYPSDYNLPNMISVGASDLNDVKCSFSNYGATSVDLFAPGELILSAYERTRCSSDDGACVSVEDHKHIEYGYHAMSGTSMATPFVTGVAALLLSIDRTLNGAQLKDKIIGSVDQVDTLQGLCATGGRLNAYNAVRAVLNNCNHSFTYSHSTDGHTSTCSICDYDETSRNAMYIVSQTSSSITVKCSVCSTQLPSCSHTLQYTSSNNTYHRISCSTCNFGLSTEHNPTYINIPNSGGHRLLCSDCGNNSTEDHTYYEISWDESEVEVGCRQCSLYISCTHQPDEEIDANTHGESCSSCGYVIAEAHSFTAIANNNPNLHTLTCTVCGYSTSESHNINYSPSTDSAYHVALCSKCGYSYTQIHTWVTTGIITKCSVCGAIDTSNVPVLSLPPEDEEELTE